MPAHLTYRGTPPALMPLFAKALLPKPGHGAGQTAIPALEASLLGVSTDTAMLSRYRAVCGFRAGTQLPATWPHVLAFPLHLKLLTDKSFPLPLLGLVHLRNTITQHRSIAAGEVLDLTVRLGNQASTERGIEFDLITEARASGALVWQENSTTLFRKREPARDGTGKTPPPPLIPYPNTLTIEAPESIGRQYGSVSGDRNPIHLYALSARAFGFPRAIAHGMWSQARILSLLEQQEGWKAGAMEVQCQFKKPLLLPGTAQLNWQMDDRGLDYRLFNRQGDAPHLAGRINWL